VTSKHRGPVRFEVVRCIVEKYPSLLLVRNHEEQTPLHVSVAGEDADADLVCLLALKEKMAKTLKDSNNNTPLSVFLSTPKNEKENTTSRNLIITSLTQNP
jgi:hypothetical protein